ncbi:hypothetical protein MTR72_09575 [Bradyrhizobium sp. ISRA442]|uniref:hypothetical protein n=1 Tax=Bradyrhizobium sp. ISRA442 TaxID=2866197 RepID=UPI00311AD185
MTASPPSKPVALETRWRAACPELKAFVERLTASLEAEEDGQGLRQRKRKAADQEKFVRAVETICCNFAAVALAFGPDGWSLAVLLGAYASSNSKIYGAHFKLVLQMMEGRGLISRTKGYKHSKHSRAVSTISPTPQYWTHAPAPESWGALSLEDPPALIVVGTDDDGKRTPPPNGVWLTQAETDMRRINAYLKSIALAVAGREVLPPRDMPNKVVTILTTPHHRTVRRVFKGTIDQGGRLYDGFWETMRREDRYPLLTIGGEPVVNVDYGQLFLRLAYAISKQTPPPGDLYDLTGHDHERADWQALRLGRKKILAATLLMRTPLRQWLGDSVEERAVLRDCFPPGTKPGHVVAGLKERHKAIAADWFERGRGLELHRLESDILIAVMLRLIDLGISALPLHDSVIVARSDGERARRVMLEEARRITGADIPVEISTGDGGG